MQKNIGFRVKKSLKNDKILISQTNSDIIKQERGLPNDRFIILYGKRLVLFMEGILFPPDERGVVLMVTYSELLLLLSLIVSIIALVIDIIKKK